MKWYWYIVCAVLIVVGIFSSIELVEMFNVASKEYGTAITIETKNNYDEIAKYDFGTIGFESDDYINFSNVTTFAPMEFDGKDKDYILLFNDQPAINTVVTNGKVVGDVNLVFYGLEGEKVSKAELHFVVEYFASQTKVTTTITNENDSVAYLETYMGINGAILKVVERSAL